LVATYTLKIEGIITKNNTYTIQVSKRWRASLPPIVVYLATASFTVLLQGQGSIITVLLP